MQAFAAEAAEHAGDHGGLLSDTTFWVAVCFVVFFLLLGKKLFGTINGALDQRAAAIRLELDESARLRAEAQTMLDDIKRKQAEGAQEAAAIKRHAEEEAARTGAAAKAALNASIVRLGYLGQCLVTISQAETDAIREVRELAVSIAISATREIIAADAAGPKGEALIDRAIAELPGRLH